MGCVYRPRDRAIWWVKYRRAGKTYYESSESTRKRDATELLRLREGKIAEGVPITPKVGKLTLAEGLRAVVEHLRMDGRKSVADAQRRIKHLLIHASGGYFHPDARMSTLTTADVERYKAHRLDQGAASATVNRELACLRRAFRLAIRGGQLVTMPYVGLLHEHNIRRGFVERHELDAILDHLPAAYHAPVQFAYHTGWRFHSEVLPLTADRVDLRAGIVRLDPGTTKSGQGRTFYVTAALRTVLQHQLDSLAQLQATGIITPYVFHRPNGARIRDLRTAWKHACQAAGYPGKLFHDFRRTAVRNLERAGVPRSTAMAMVGHQTESIYRRYAIVDEAMHREAAAKLDAWADGQDVPPSTGQVRSLRPGIK